METTNPRPAATAAPSPLVPLQQTIGNRAVGRLVQAKLRVGPAGDRFEREADRVADQVLHAPTPAPAVIAVAPVGGAPQRMCAKCERELPREADDAAGRERDEPRFAAGAPLASGDEARLAALGPGRPLAASLRAFLEPRFGHDFSRVRVHTDARAAESARAVNARAYTVGRDVVFGANEYAPTSHGGRELLAHELAHTIQQRAATGAPPSPDPHGPFESSARGAARDVAGGRAVSGDFPACGIGLARAPADREALDRAAAVAEAEAVIARMDRADHDEDDEPAAKPAVRRNRTRSKFSPGGFTDEDIYREYNQATARLAREERERLDRQRRSNPQTAEAAISIMEEARTLEEKQRSSSRDDRAFELVLNVERWLARITRPENMHRHFGRLPFTDNARVFPGKAYENVQIVRRKLGLGATIGGWWELTINTMKAAQEHLEVLAGQRKLASTSIPEVHAAMKRGAKVTPLAVAGAAMAPGVIAVAGPAVVGAGMRGAQALPWLAVRAAPRLTTWAGRHPILATELVGSGVTLAEKAKKGQLTGWDLLLTAATLGLAHLGDVRLQGGAPGRGESVPQKRGVDPVRTTGPARPAAPLRSAPAPVVADPGAPPAPAGATPAPRLANAAPATPQLPSGRGWLSKLVQESLISAKLGVTGVVPATRGVGAGGTTGQARPAAGLMTGSAPAPHVLSPTQMPDVPGGPAAKVPTAATGAANRTATHSPIPAVPRTDLTHGSSFSVPAVQPAPPAPARTVTPASGATFTPSAGPTRVGGGGGAASTFVTYAHKEMLEIFIRTFKKPGPPREAYHVYPTVAAYQQAWLGLPGVNPGAPIPPGFFMGDTRVIHLPPDASTLTVFHEALHWASNNAGFGQRMGQFVDEGMTEWLTQRAFGSQAYRINYGQNVAFVKLLAGYVGEETLTTAFLDANWQPLYSALEGLLGSSDAAERFVDLLRRTPVEGGEGVGKAIDMLTQ